MVASFFPTAELVYANQELPETIIERLRCQKGADKLDLSLCNIKKVPIEYILVHFGSQPECLDLSYNVIRCISPRFTMELCQISKLDLSMNKIERLPDNFGNLKELTYLDLHKNRLQTLPLSMWKMTGLQYLRVSANPFREPLKTFLERKGRTVSTSALAELLVTFLKERAVVKIEAVRKSDGIKSPRKDSMSHRRKRSSKYAMMGDYIDHEPGSSSSEEGIVEDFKKVKVEESATSDATTSIDKDIYPMTAHAMRNLMLLTIGWNILIAYFVDKSYLEDLANKYPYWESIWLNIYEPVYTIAAPIAAAIPKNPEWILRGPPPPLVEFTEPVGFFDNMLAVFKSLFGY